MKLKLMAGSIVVPLGLCGAILTGPIADKAGLGRLASRAHVEIRPTCLARGAHAHVNVWLWGASPRASYSVWQLISVREGHGRLLTGFPIFTVRTNGRRVAHFDTNGQSNWPESGSAPGKYAFWFPRYKRSGKYVLKRSQPHAYVRVVRSAPECTRFRSSH